MMETFKNTLGFLAAAAVLVFIATVEEPKSSGPYWYLQGFGRLAPTGQTVAIWHSTDSEMCVTSTFLRRDPSGCTWVRASRVTVE
jgi:hypothetical protein